jgi:LuxR family maltose regulon positive regulatory protein
MDAAFALASWYLPRDGRRARRWASDMLECAQVVGTRSYEVRARLMLAAIEAASGAQYKAMVHLRAAVGQAARLRIALPFIEQAALTPLIRQLRRELWDAGEDPIEASFLSDIEEKLAALTPAEGPMSLLSAREQEVVAELSRGLTNKEIARALDMTEHTVKFHLKNIFAKLGVDRRAHALSAVRQTRKASRPT